MMTGIASVIAGRLSFLENHGQSLQELAATGAPHERLPRLMDEYIDFINSRQLEDLTFSLSYAPYSPISISSKYNPLDPFSDTPSRRIELLELLQDYYLQSAYRNVTRRTFHRELIRLRSLGFIKFTLDDAVQDWVVELDFEAISKY